MTDTQKAIAAVETLGYSGLITVEAILGGFDTPLIDHYNLRDLVPAFRAANPSLLADAMTSRRASLAARRKITVGVGRLGDTVYDIVRFVD